MAFLVELFNNHLARLLLTSPKTNTLMQCLYATQELLRSHSTWQAMATLAAGASTERRSQGASAPTADDPAVKYKDCVSLLAALPSQTRH